ncbi:TetR/AcrR family transcriptional regulator [filamentous cyanobacterium CCP3]|nr:TetR/AcrR family transcriptional regulator [filamentous cyanobacterium CCP3]
MAKQTPAKQSYVPTLLDLFRQYGYDGVSLSKISEATGLGKASLYHHFPGGKDDMVETVLVALEQFLEKTIQEGLAGEGDALTRLTRMSDRIRDGYDHGKKPCILAALALGSAKETFQPQVKQLLGHWIDAIATVLIESGMEQDVAQRRGEEAMIAIQGSLIVSRVLDDPSIFERTMAHLPEQLCR